jgi:hypothetical protein
MRTIYIDSDNKCHVTNDGTMTAVEVRDFFDGKCDAFVEGYCCEVGETGTAIYPWRDSAILEAYQEQYETTNAELAAAYQEGVNSID